MFDVDVDKLATQFKENGFVVIDNFLDPVYADKLGSFLVEMPDNWWWASSWPTYDFKETIEFNRNESSNLTAIQRARCSALRWLDSGLFSYFFFRTVNDHHPGCDCKVCETCGILRSTETLDFLNKICRLGLTHVFECFANKYASGCWLGTHSDDANGKLAFVLHMTAMWNESWGGLYVASKPDGQLQCIRPQFNKLAIFSVGAGQTPHCVTPILPGLTASRYAISGWFR